MIQNSKKRKKKPEIFCIFSYTVMLDCWKFLPESRPLFEELVERLATLIGNDSTQYYIDLNEPYLKMNANFYEDGQIDNAALLTTPNYTAPAPPVADEIEIDCV